MSLSAQGRTASINRTDLTLLLLRAMIGVVFIAHGSQKLFGAFDGPGLDVWTDVVDEQGVPAPGLFAVVGAVAEFGGGVLLLLGLLTPLGGLAIIAMMIGAIKLETGSAGFFTQNGGYEYNLVLIAIALALIATGPGRISLDHRLDLERRAHAVLGQRGRDDAAVR